MGHMTQPKVSKHWRK